MLSLTITDLKKFTAMIFSEDCFDRFLLHDAEFRTSVLIRIDGEKDPDFYGEEEREKEMRQPCITWREVRPSALKLLSGKRLPLYFKIVLITAPDTAAVLQEKAGFTDCTVTSLSLNILYRAGVLSLTSGVSYAGFSLDKSMEKYWDGYVLSFLEKKEVTFEGN